MAKNGRCSDAVEVSGALLDSSGAFFEVVLDGCHRSGLERLGNLWGLQDMPIVSCLSLNGSSGNSYMQTFLDSCILIQYQTHNAHKASTFSRMLRS